MGGKIDRMGNFNEKVGHLYHFVNFFIRNEVFTPNLNAVANILIFQMHRYDGAALEAERSRLYRGCLWSGCIRKTAYLVRWIDNNRAGC